MTTSKRRGSYRKEQQTPQIRSRHLLARRSKLLIDPVVNDASSINARLVSNLDVRMNENPQISQLIVFDDRLKWKSSDLKLL